MERTAVKETSVVERDGKASEEKLSKRLKHHVMVT
jgi:hypothetical protein